MKTFIWKMCVAFGAAEPLYRMRPLTRGTSTSNATHRASPSSLIDEVEEREFEGSEIELDDTATFN